MTRSVGAVGAYAHGAVCAGALIALVESSAPAASSVCSVLSHHPCAPTYCSPFRHRPCFPFYAFPLGENLQLSIESSGRNDQASSDPDGDGRHKVDNIHEMFATLRACWQPPPADEAHEGMQMSVRLSFRSDGTLKGEPRVTYVAPDTPPDTRQAYQQAIKASLDRCTPMPFTRGMSGAIAGRPIAIRFIDNRPVKREDHP
jgi:hypothetical protein